MQLMVTADLGFDPVEQETVDALIDDLTELMLPAFESAGFRVALHSQLPPTDGSLAAGQLWVAAQMPHQNVPHRNADSQAPRLGLE